MRSLQLCYVTQNGKREVQSHIRLSLDEAVTESLSIGNQRLILERHIEELDIPNAEVIEFVDNDYKNP